MAFCSKCGGHVDSDAKFCPKCGNGVERLPVIPPKKPSKMKPVLIVLACVFGFAFIAAVYEQFNTDSKSVNNSPINSTTISVQAINIDATALIKAYSANQVAADQSYKGKTLVVTGTIDSIQSDGTVYINGGFLDTVFCDFPSSQIANLASLRKGQSVSIQGVCTGVGPIGGVFLDSCKLVG